MTGSPILGWSTGRDRALDACQFPGRGGGTVAAPKDPMRSIMFSLLGAREHYAPVVMAERAGWLGCLVTDLWHPWGRVAHSLAVRSGINVLSRVAGRYNPCVPSVKLRALTHLCIDYKSVFA